VLALIDCLFLIIDSWFFSFFSFSTFLLAPLDEDSLLRDFLLSFLFV